MGSYEDASRGARVFPKVVGDHNQKVGDVQGLTSRVTPQGML